MQDAEQQGRSTVPENDQLAVKWELVTNMLEGESRFQARFEFTNKGNKVFPNTGWTLYFNQIVGGLVPGSVSDEVEMEVVSGEFYQLKPSASFPELQPGESVSITYEGNGFLIKESSGPKGLYLVFENADGTEKAPEMIKDYSILPFERPEQLKRVANDPVQTGTPKGQWLANEWIIELDERRVPKIIPTPLAFNQLEQDIYISPRTLIRYKREFYREAKYLNDRLEGILGQRVQQEYGDTPGPNTILITSGTLTINQQTISAGGNGYYLGIRPDGQIIITATDEAGAHYAVQTLLSLMDQATPSTPVDSFAIQVTSVKDAPRFAYRGIHLDVSRNFHSKATVKKLLDVMAMYKLNKFHFHLTDDEGWRLEIPELPELTAVGAFRGHTKTELDRLRPAYGSGPYADPAVSHGSGYYTRDDFIEILQYANERHIEVIPEFDFPGHARAAIKAMIARQTKLAEAGNQAAADQYILHDPNDESEYKSVQNYDDNVICPCQESTYRFLDLVVSSTIQMYLQARAPLTTIHIGGDEVPAGVWEKSPLCQKLIEESPDLQSTKDLFPYFVKRFDDILDKHQLITAGWEEIALKKVETADGSHYEPNPELVGDSLQPYIWNNLWGMEDLANRVANAGFPVVLCNVTNLYFDMAYSKDPKEHGLHWGGFVDTRKVYEFVPEDIFKSTTTDNLGFPIDTERLYAEEETLTEKGLSNILGIQGQLWSETILGEEMLEHLALPKLLALAERAWAAQPEWATMEEDRLAKVAFNNEWSAFANAVAKREFPRLDRLNGGYSYWLPLPGVVSENGIMKANTSFPGLKVHLTTDGREPTAEDYYYQVPIPAKEVVKLRVFSPSGRGGRTLTIHNSDTGQSQPVPEPVPEAEHDHDHDHDHDH